MNGLGDLLKLTSLPQKLMLGGASLALVGAVGWNVVQLVENHNLTKQNETLTSRIEDPATGYIVKLHQAEVNTQVTVAAIQHQNSELRAQSQRDAAMIASVQRRYDAEHIARTKAEASAAAFLAHKPTGNTETERMQDVDRQILGDLK